MLEKALGTPEHSGRTRGVGAFAPWKTGRNWTLEDKRASKKAKRELYENELRERIVAEVMEKIRGEGGPSVAQPAPSVDVRRSSCASRMVTTTDTHDTSYPCDDIEVIKPIDHAN